MKQYLACKGTVPRYTVKGYGVEWGRSARELRIVATKISWFHLVPVV